MICWNFLFLQLILLFTIVSSESIVENEDQLEEFLKSSKMSRESKQMLREYQKEGALQFPLDPFNFLAQLQSMFSQLPNIFSSVFKFPFFFSPADTRISVDKSHKDEDY
ncbi:uncharacterized protein CELE_C41C4.9 [Caenorhabditis elegans]|uniref:Uncharacterized protein n=1 Tax=Caenorhabditis elegans TaxID=6239 RepID=Q7YX62_CAEEL|nr:Uncharacterized protein CELE_C41C4.9 [Caenorhabditis elegans]CAE17738.1 Uncharacterized protein CELE_C41C4.9 [Caenorhabditis elegans]|eukprot:NP_001022024.1 Uncharacterized protein CELE_C41C4.9 [Caenorhabditis elegans]